MRLVWANSIDEDADEYDENGTVSVVVVVVVDSLCLRTSGDDDAGVDADGVVVVVGETMRPLQLLPLPLLLRLRRLPMWASSRHSLGFVFSILCDDFETKFSPFI